MIAGLGKWPSHRESCPKFEAPRAEDVRAITKAARPLDRGSGVRTIAEEMKQAEPKAIMVRIADEYERVANMLVNSVTAITRASPGLKRVVLVTGTKYYGVHLGPVKTPMLETDPRHLPPNYYFDQIDWLTAFQREKEWDWVELRPQTLCGFAPGSPMSILPAIAVYAALSKELGLPLRFPGKPGAYDTIYQVTESTHFSNAALWAASRTLNETR